MRIKNSFDRAHEYVSESSEMPFWLEKVANEIATEQANREKTAVTVVELRRKRDREASIFDQMSAIVSGTAPKFSSVEEAVEHYQDRTGMKSMSRKRAMENAALMIIQAGEEEDEGKA